MQDQRWQEKPMQTYSVPIEYKVKALELILSVIIKKVGGKDAIKEVLLDHFQEISPITGVCTTPTWLDDFLTELKL